MLNHDEIKNIGESIKKERKKQNLTQDDLAGLSNTGRRFISELEAGKSTVQLGKVLLVLNALGLTFTIQNKWQAK